jgi:hypothetical protein
MYPDNGSVHHLDGAIMGLGEGFHNEAVPDASCPPADKAVVAGRARPKPSGKSRHGAPERSIQKMPLRTRRSLTLGTPRGLFGRKGLKAVHSRSVSSYLIDSRLRFGSLNHAYSEVRHVELAAPR